MTKAKDSHGPAKPHGGVATLAERIEAKAMATPMHAPGPVAETWQSIIDSVRKIERELAAYRGMIIYGGGQRAGISAGEPAGDPTESWDRSAPHPHNARLRQALRECEYALRCLQDASWPDAERPGMVSMAVTPRLWSTCEIASHSARTALSDAGKKIESGNAAFSDGNAGSEVARILREVARKVEDSQDGSGRVMDVNGNACGHWSMADDSEVTS